MEMNFVIYPQISQMTADFKTELGVKEGDAREVIRRLAGRGGGEAARAGRRTAARRAGGQHLGLRP